MTLPNVDEPQQIKAAPGSGLAALRGKRAKAVESLHIDLPVQRSEELFGQTVYVRYRPFTDSERRRNAKLVEKRKGDDTDIVGNSMLLARCALGVFTDHERDTPEEWMRFDPALAALILDVDEDKVEQSTAAEVARLLYLTEGDLTATALKVSEFSGYTLDELEDATAGN